MKLFFLSLVPNFIYMRIIFFIKNKRFGCRFSGRFTDFLLYKKMDLSSLDYNEVKLRKLVSDRILVRDFVQNKNSEIKLIPLLWKGDRLNENIWNDLPIRFVIKATHGSQMVLVVNKKIHTMEFVINLVRKWLRNDYSILGREWVYAETPRNIVIEEFLSCDDGNPPPDFKLFSFQGKLKMVQIDNDRFSSHSRCLYDENGNFLNVKNSRFVLGEEGNIKHLIPRLTNVSKILGEDFDFIRIDVYYVNDNLYFGELTNFPGNGLSGYIPDSFDFSLGNCLIDRNTSFEAYKIRS